MFKTTKTIITLFLIFICSFNLYAQVNGDSWRNVQNKGKGQLTILYYETPAFIYQNEEGQIKGICAEILNDFQSYLKSNYQVELELNYKASDQNFSAFLEKVKNAPTGIVGVGNVSITDKRKKDMKFSNSYFKNITVMLTHQQNPRLKNLENISKQFEGYTAWVVKGSTFEQHIKEIKDQYFPDLQIKYAATGKELLNEIVNDPKTFTVTDFIDYYAARKKHLPVRSHLSASTLPHEQLGYVMPLHSDWQAVFNEFLGVNYTNSLTYKRIVNNNLGASFVNFMEKI